MSKYEQLCNIQFIAAAFGICKIFSNKGDSVHFSNDFFDVLNAHANN